MFSLPTRDGYIAVITMKNGKQFDIEESIDQNKDLCEMKAQRYIRRNKLKNVEFTITQCIY